MLRIFFCFCFGLYKIASTTICSKQVLKCSCGCFVLFIYDALCDKSNLIIGFIIDVFVSARVSQCGTAHHMTISVVHETFNKIYIYFLPL